MNITTETTTSTTTKTGTNTKTKTRAIWLAMAMAALSGVACGGGMGDEKGPTGTGSTGAPSGAAGGNTWSIGGAAGAGGSSSLSNPSTPGSQPAPADLAVCQRACSTMVSCGVEYDSTCAANCLNVPLFLDCARTATDCNALALCAFRVDSALTCGGSTTGGYPAGTDSCGTAALCEGVCAANSQPASCRCACNARMAPSQAINLLINNQCAVAKCPTECGATGNGPACVSCFQARCQPESAQCTAATPVTTSPSGTSGTTGGTGSSPATSTVPKLPTQPTAEVAPTGTLDPQLVGTWPVTGVQVYWDGSSLPDWTASDPLRDGLASAPLLLGADGSFSFGPMMGTWTVVPFPASDPAEKALWGTGGRGPDGYLRELVLVVNGRVYSRGPIEDPFPPATVPSGLRLGFRVASPQAGEIMLFIQRPTTSAGNGTKK